MAIDHPSCTDLLLRRDAPPFPFHDAVEPEFRQRVEHFLDQVRRRGYDELELAPPVCRMLWQHGFALPPPVFLSVAGQLFLGAVCSGLLFGTGMTLFLGALALSVGGFSVLMLLPFLFCCSAASFGTLFGIFYILRIRYLSWILNLPEWSQFGLPAIDQKTTRYPLHAGQGCPRCGNDPLACHTHRQVWCDKCAHDLKAMGDEGWSSLAHGQDASCAVSVAAADVAADYTRCLPPADSW